MRSSAMHFECKFFPGPFAVGQEDYSFLRERDIPHNYFLIEQPAARERRFQFAAESSNAFIPRKRTQPENHLSLALLAELYLNALLPSSSFLFLQPRITNRCRGFAILSRGMSSLWTSRKEKEASSWFSDRIASTVRINNRTWFFRSFSFPFPNSDRANHADHPTSRFADRKNERFNFCRRASM